MSTVSMLETLESRRLFSASVISNAALLGLTEQPYAAQDVHWLLDRRGTSHSAPNANPDRLRTLPHREQCAGTITSVQPGTLFFAGRGVASHFGKYSIQGSNDFDEQGNVTNGVFTTTTADGSILTGTYSGTYTPLPGGHVRFDVEARWLTGTGRFEGVTGRGDVVAVLDAVAPGAGFQYVTQGTLTFPG